jgi:hypothetical protein
MWLIELAIAAVVVMGAIALLWIAVVNGLPAFLRGVDETLTAFWPSRKPWFP